MKTIGEHMKIVSVINYKGGVGKTTLTANLGAELAYRGKKVLLIDLDPQASLTFSFFTPEYWTKSLADKKTIKQWFDSYDTGPSPLTLNTLIAEPARAKNRGVEANGGLLHIIPSHLGLINVDLELAAELSGTSLKQSKMKYLRVHRRLAEGLNEQPFEEYDIVLIDCPPNFNVVTKTAIVASDSILIPAKADYLSTLGIDYLQRNLNQLVGDYNEYAKLETGKQSDVINPQILGVVFTMLQIYGGQPISALRPYISQTKALGVPVFDSFIRENKTFFTDAPRSGVPVVLHGEPNFKHIVEELEELVSEFQNKAGL
ncbi:chromosome partitioning protein [Allocatelliglobosispora scoriae]|uniref:Chromosome partitioning protein n=1 Tax=Allocatelliglobosispora scoriae TaxID=643052 RepID=A0A841BWL2_9ACTN|nr:AAA family ATPase [Allocatelliglobosispora scoriae]MBB5871896.1 chromosome partitioning protein [Allocatelliglobosispora scoriae]